VDAKIAVVRRRLLQAATFLPLAALPVTLLRSRDAWSASLTPSCGDSDHPTEAQTEGPFFKPRSPSRASLVDAGMKGTPLVVEGFVLDTRCRPLDGALLDFWQADNDGDYDNRGFTLRGHQFTDANGRFRLETIVPGSYPGRTRHIHVKVQARDGRPLTTQLYFPGEPRNARDFLFRPALQMAMRDAEQGRAGSFSFVLESA
jgi:protocatechuate 3,4-dioxygenase beta subunit